MAETVGENDLSWWSGLGNGSLSWLGWLVLVLLMLALLPLQKVLESEREQLPKPPNILLLLADDLGVNDVGYSGNPIAHTPSIDALAGAGVRFERHYADATCSPSRVALLTGRFSQRSGFRPNGIVIPDEFPTLAELLALRGYQTALTGKWHAGEMFERGWPLQKGFQKWFGFLVQWQLGAVLAHDHPKHYQPTYIDPVLRSENAPPQKYSGHLTDILLEHSKNQLHEFARSDQPWFLMHAFFAPHKPIQAHPRFAAKFSATPEGQYRALIAHMDWAVGEMIDVLKEKSMLENTVVVFLSDNGGTNEVADNNFPYAGAKNGNREGSYRTPMLLHWPHRLQPRREQKTVMNVDIMPSLLQLAGVDLPMNLDGRSFAPLLFAENSDAVQWPLTDRLWEDHNWSMETLTSSYLGAGQTIRYSSTWGVPDSMVDLTQNPSGAGSQEPDRKKVYAEYRPLLLPELERLSTLLDVSLQAEQTNFSFSGHAAQRTPGLAGVSIGLGLTLRDQPLETLLLAEQKGVWSLKLTPEFKLEWNVLGASLSSNALVPGQCSEVVLSSSSQGMMHGGDNKARLKMFVDRGLADSSVISARKILEQDLQQATQIYPHAELSYQRLLLSNLPRSSRHDSYEMKIDRPALVRLLNRKRRNAELFFPDIADLAWQGCSI